MSDSDRHQQEVTNNNITTTNPKSNRDPKPGVAMLDLDDIIIPTNPDNSIISTSINNGATAQRQQHPSQRQRQKQRQKQQRRQSHSISMSHSMNQVDLQDVHHVVDVDDYNALLRVVATDSGEDTTAPRRTTPTYGAAPLAATSTFLTLNNTNTDDATDDNETEPREVPNTTSNNTSNNNNNNKHVPGPQEHYTFGERQARRVARYPKTHLIVSLVVATVLSVIGIIMGDFTITIDNIGWPSRGTEVSNRQTQNLLIQHYLGALSYKADPYYHNLIWEGHTTVVQPGWETRDWTDYATPDPTVVPTDITETKTTTMISQKDQSEIIETRDMDVGNRLLRRSIVDLIETCDTEEYTRRTLLENTKLWPIWQVSPDNATASATDQDALEDLCLAEEETQRVLKEHFLCYGCDNGECLPPYSLVLYARFTVSGGFAMDCPTLAAAWAPYRDEEEAKWIPCIAYLRQAPGDIDIEKLLADPLNPCPTLFSPALVDSNFEQTGRVQYTSTLFMTYHWMGDALYDVYDDFDGGSDKIKGVYDTQYGHFIELYANDIVNTDLLLAAGSGAMTVLAMMLHTRSPFLTLVGLFQIMLSFPLAYFFYHFVLGLTFFPFLNLIGIFVSFALGADHVFVAVDKWKNMRNDYPHATTEEVAGKAFPNAGKAMVLTTITTAVAFFASALSPVAPIVLFSTFSGMLIVLDYILDIAVMFPCLCIYDGYRFQQNYFMDFRCRNNEGNDSAEAVDENDASSPPVITELATGDLELEKTNADNNSNVNNDAKSYSVAAKVIANENENEVEVENAKGTAKSDTLDYRSELDHQGSNSLIRRILHRYYTFLHTFRWPLFALSFAALGVCTYSATTLEISDTPTDVQLLASDTEPEMNRAWRSNLLLDSFVRESGSIANIVWGVKPADTGNHLDPTTFSTLVLEDTASFDPSSVVAQEYLRDFCESFFAEEFADLLSEGYECPMNQFDQFLKYESLSPPENRGAAYTEHCNEAVGIPVDPASFHACITAWSEQQSDSRVLSWNGTVRIIHLAFRSRVRYNSPVNELRSEWNLIESWMQNEPAPPEVSRSFFTSQDWWWWDTTSNVFQTAINSAMIAIAVSAVVILVTSRSISMTFFSAISVFYVLVSVSAVMNAAGWTLGFLESICFTILIGLSGDFVVHFSHAYTELPGNADRGTRTKYALIHLGPSILAAGFTTLAGAAVMVFATVYFLHLFALVLFFTIIQATVGSFVVFLVLTDCVGPSNPTAAIDWLMAKLTSCCCPRGEVDGSKVDEGKVHDDKVDGSQDSTPPTDESCLPNNASQDSASDDSKEDSVITVANL